jgi:Tol biopolymer transport system component
VLPQLASVHTPNRSKLYVATLDGTRVGTPSLVTDKTGYVNQPAFTPDSAGLYFTWRPDGGQSDLWLHDLRDRSEHAVTCTSTEEYVATPLPDGRLTAIRVEADLTKHLVILAPHEKVLFPAVANLGAYRWVDDHTVALMTAAPDGTTTLALGDVATGNVERIAEHVGGAIAVLPGQRAISYVDTSGERMTLRRADLATRATTELLELPDGADTVAWLEDGSALAGNGTKLVRATIGDAWKDFADLTGALAGPITRVVVSPDHRRLAIVVHVD